MQRSHNASHSPKYQTCEPMGCPRDPERSSKDPTTIMTADHAATKACAEGAAPRPVFGVRRNDSKTWVTSEPIMRNTHKLYIWCLVPWASLRKHKHWHLKSGGGEVWDESCMKTTTFHKAFVSSSRRTAETIDEPQRIHSCFFFKPGSWVYHRLSRVIKICKCINAIPPGD